MFAKTKKLLGLSFVLVLVALATSACSITTSSSNKTTQDTDSSVFLSINQGDNWRPMTATPVTSGSAGSIASLDVNLISMDPQDSLALYLASFEKGLYYTYNISKGWNQVAGLPTATINDVKVDPKNKCIIYAAISNRIYRSSDCSRTWSQIYFDNNTGVSVNTVVVDHYNPKNLYIGTSRGEIIKSIDSGDSWRTIQRLQEGVSRLIISPLDSRLLFVATSKNNIYTFTSNTDTNAANVENIDANFLISDWTDLNDVLKEYNLGTSFKDVVVCTKDGTMFLATEKFFLRSKDNGLSWESIKLIQPETAAIINAIAVDPQNSNNLYYVTNTTFFRSSDAGVTWTTKKLPTMRAGRELLIDFNNPNVIYLGTMKIKK